MENEENGVDDEALDVPAVLVELESDVDSEFEDESDAFQQDNEAM